MELKEPTVLTQDDTFSLVIGRFSPAAEVFDRAAELSGARIVDRRRKPRLLSVRWEITARGTSAQLAEFGQLVDAAGSSTTGSVLP